MSEFLRTFIAVPLSDDCRRAIATIQRTFRQLPCDVRWEEEDKFHITLKFLGDTSQEQIQILKKELEIRSKQFFEFEISFNNLGTFPNQRAPRIVWIGISEPETLAPIQEAVESVCQYLGFPKENRPFHPHVTLGRIKSNRNLHCLTEEIKSITFEAIQSKCNSIALMKSDLKPGGSVYSLIQKFPFQP